MASRLADHEADRNRLEFLKAIEPHASRVAVLAQGGYAPAIRRERLAGVAVREGSLVFSDRQRILSWMAPNRVLAIFSWRRFVDEGGLMSFGVDLAELYRRFAGYVDRLLKGADLANLPVDQPRLELVINLKTAKALGLAIPHSVLLRADEVIQ